MNIEGDRVAMAIFPTAVSAWASLRTVLGRLWLFTFRGVGFSGPFFTAVRLLVRPQAKI